MNIQTLLKEAGPYTAPLCVAMAWAIQWLLVDRKRLLGALSDSLKRERAGAENRTMEALESTRLLAESNLTQRETLHEHDRLLDKLIDRIDRWLSSNG